MTGEQFQEWIALMNCKNDRVAAALLDVGKDSIARFKRDGTTEIRTDLACAALLAGIPPFGSEPKRK